MEAKAPAWPPIESTWSSQKLDSSVLRRAVGGDETGFLDAGSGYGGAKAGRLEIRPGALGAGGADLMDVEPVGLGERLRGRCFDGRGKAGQHGERGGDERGNNDRGKSFDHDGRSPVRWPFGLSFRWYLGNQRQFRLAFAQNGKWFRPGPFCFVGTARTKQKAISLGMTRQAGQRFKPRGQGTGARLREGVPAG